MAYDKKTLEDDILENLKKFDDNINIIFNNDRTIITLDNIGMTAYLSNDDKNILWNEEYCDKLISHMYKVKSDINSFYKSNIQREPIIKCLPETSDNMSLKILLDNKRELSYDLFNDNFITLTDRQKMGIMRDEINESKKEHSLERTVRRISRNAEEKGVSEEEVKNQIYEVFKKYEAVEKARVDSKTEAEINWDDVGDNHDVENPSDISKAPIEKEIKQEYTKVLQKFSDKLLSNELKDVMSNDKNTTKESKIIGVTLYDNLEKDLEPLTGTYRGTIIITNDIDRLTLQNITDNGIRLGIETLSEDLSKSFSNDMREYLSLNQKVDKTQEDIEILNANKITRLLSDKELKKDENSIFQVYSEDFLKNNLTIEKLDNGEVAKYTGGREDSVVAIVPLKESENFNITFNLLNDTMKKLPEDVTTRSVRATMDDGTAYEYSSRSSKNAEKDTYRNTDSITALDGESFNTLYITRNGNPTATFNTNDNKFMRSTAKPLGMLRDEFQKTLPERTDKIIPNEITVVNDKLNNATIVHDIPNDSIHCINNATFDKLSIKYDGARKNQEAQAYLENVLNNYVTSLDDAINVALGCDGKNSVILKPSDTINLENNIIMQKCLANDAYKSVIKGENNTTIGIVVDEKTPDSIVRIKDGEIVQHTNQEALSNIEYTEKINKLSDILDTTKKDAVSYVKGIESLIDK